MTLATVLLCALFVCLGRWQWHRGEGKQRAAEAFEQETSRPPLRTSANLDALPRYRLVTLNGTFETRRQFLLDNRFFKGSPGYEVLTPFVLPNGRRILVDRGWVPFSGYRDQLPDVSIDLGSLSTNFDITGRLDELPSAGLASGRAAPSVDESWPKVTAFPTHEELEAALGEKIERRILLLTSPDYAYAHDWAPPGLPADRHFSYAIQWWGFALVLLVLYFGLNFRKVS